MVKVLFVCMGNICRSPMGQGVFEKLVDEAGLSERIQVDSAGTHTYHVGEPPDPRALTAAQRRGYSLHTQRARRVTEDDIEQFDYVVAMDYDNLSHLRQICPPGAEQKLVLFMEYAEDLTVREVPDPYYGARSGFERVLDLVEEAARGLLEEIRSQHDL